MDMVIFVELFFTLALSVLVFVIFVMLNSHNFVQGSKNLQSSEESVYYIKNLARKDDHYSTDLSVTKVVGDSKIIETAPEKMKGNEQVDEILEEPEFQETEESPSEEEGNLDEGLLLGDWEGVERTDLEKSFGDAVVFVDANKNAGDVVDNELKMQLYGLHKIATEGPCYGSQPMPFKISARKKWSSWHGLGDMSREKAMEKYVALLSDRVADWKIDKATLSGLGTKGYV